MQETQEDSITEQALNSGAKPKEASSKVTQNKKAERKTEKHKKPIWVITSQRNKSDKRGKITEKVMRK